MKDEAHLNRTGAHNSARVTVLMHGIILFFLASLSHTGLATTILGMDIDVVAQQAELIFEGAVVQHDTQMDNATGIVSTYVTFEITDVIKGDFSGSQLELKFTGGVYNGQAVQVSGLKIPAVGEEGIYFVESATRDLINPLLGWSQGHFIIAEEGGERRVTTADNRSVTDVMPVTNIPATIKKPLGLVDGNGDTAAGVLTDSNPLQVERAILVEDFKARILELIEN